MSAQKPLLITAIIEFFYEFFEPYKESANLSNDMFKEIAQYLTPIEAYENQTPISFNAGQQHILRAKQKRIKLLGIAGSGKTEVLCTKVASCPDKEDGFFLSEGMKPKTYIKAH